MAIFLNFQFIAPLLVGLFSLAMGIAVLRTDSRNVTYWHYFFIMLWVAVWSFFVAIFHVPEIAHDTWTMLHWVAGFFIAPAYLLFLITFPSRKEVVPVFLRILFWLGPVAMSAAVLAWPEYFVTYIEVSVHQVPKISVGPYAWMLELYFPLYFVPGFFFAGRKFLRAVGVTRAHMLTGLSGLAIGSTGALVTNVNLAIHAGKEFIWLGPIFAAIAPASIAYMLFGLREGRPRLFPALWLGGLVLIALSYFTITADRVESMLLNGIILMGVVLLILFLVRTSLIESADARRFQDLSRRLQRANEELKHADRVKTEFLAIVSHHLRTPLTHIKWALTELAEGNYGRKLAPAQQKLTKELLANNERLVDFIESFMDTSRIETGKIVLEKDSVSVETTLRELAAAIEDRAKNYYRVEIEFLPSTEEIPLIVADKESVWKVFESILENALIYNRPGGKIYINIVKEEDSVKVEVTDTGIGINADDLQRVGEKFFRSKSAKRREAEGTGLGIFIARHIIKLHHGTFDISSEIGKGTAVTITLPFSGTSLEKKPYEKKDNPQNTREADTV
jgi:signal transduction histidine kinase